MSATANTFPYGQCTYWADERYHQLTGVYVPWNGNAKDWVSGARANGWKVSTQAPKGIPSIICLQPTAGQGLAGAGLQYGHVAVVEQVNADGSVYTSNMNWPSQTKVTYVTFQPGPGVNFLWISGGTAINSNSPTTATLANTNGSGPVYTPILQQVHETLVDTPGFYGIALAVDEAEQFPGWIDLTQPIDWQIMGADLQFPDVVGMGRSFGATVTDNFLPFAIRSGLVTIGLILLIALIVKAVGKPVMAVAGPLLQSGL